MRYITYPIYAVVAIVLIIVCLANREMVTLSTLPEGLAAMLADSDAKAADGWLFDDSKTLSSLIGRPTTKLAEML